MSEDFIEEQDAEWEEHVTTDIGQFAQIPLWFLELRPPPSSRAIHCLAVLLAKFADRHTNRCYPSRQTIGETMGASVDTVDRAVAELIKLGVLSKYGKVRADGQRSTNTYAIALTKPHQCEGYAANLRSPIAANLRSGGRKSARAEPELDNQNQKEPKKRTLASPLTPEEEDSFAAEFSDVPHVRDEIESIKGKPVYFVSKNKPAEMRRFLNFARDNARKFNTPRSAAGTVAQPSSAALHNPVPKSSFEDQKVRDKAAWKAAREKGFA